MHCPKCGDVNTYHDGAMFACRKCGNRWLPEGVKPYYVRHAHGDKKEEGIMSEKGCSNCHRDMDTRYGGHCITCYNARKGLTPGTPEYETALENIRAKIADGNLSKRGGNQRGGKKAKGVKPARAHDQRAMLKSGQASTESAIIDHLIEQRDEFLAKARKLDQAIELLS